MTSVGRNNPEYVFEHNGQRYVCWAQSAGVSDAASAVIANAHWHVLVGGREYRLFEAHADDLRDDSMTWLLEGRIVSALGDVRVSGAG